MKKDVIYDQLNNKFIRLIATELTFLYNQGKITLIGKKDLGDLLFGDCIQYENKILQYTAGSIPFDKWDYNTLLEFDLKEELKEGFVYFRKFDTKAFQEALHLQMEANKALNELMKYYGVPIRKKVRKGDKIE